MKKVSLIQLMRAARILYDSFGYNTFFTLCKPERSGHVDMTIVRPGTLVEQGESYHKIANFKAMNVITELHSNLTAAQNMRLFP